MCCEHIPCLAYQISAFHFGEEDSISPTACHCCQVFQPPECCQPIDPHNAFTPTIFSGTHRLTDLLPCCGFRIWGNGILQIKNQSISRQRFGLFQSPPIRPRHIQHAPAWSHPMPHSCFPFFLRPVSAPLGRICIPALLPSADSSSCRQNCGQGRTAPHRSATP